jgi:hypothetical protein
VLSYGSAVRRRLRSKNEQLEEVAIRTSVEFWGVGASSQTFLPLDTSQIAGHLLADWVPSLPAAVGSSFIGWPPFLIEVVRRSGRQLLAVRTEAGRSERQWKSVLSWMLGVAGTRHVLASEGYRWVAPVSAFYANAAQVVDLSAWHPAFPRSIVRTSRRPRSGSKLCPDYLALRPTTQAPGALEWAVAESKGSRRSLTNLQTCPPAWSKQARNIIVKVRGSTVSIPRHIVVATRVNPAGREPWTRRMQVRAWNQKDDSPTQLSPDAAVEIVSAHLFGLFRGLHMPRNALAVAISVQERRETSVQARRPTATADERARLFESADVEFRERIRRTAATRDGSSVVDTELGAVAVNLAEPLLTLSGAIREARTADEAFTAVKRADSELDDWQRSRPRNEEKHGIVFLPFGVELQMPDSFEPRK